MSMWTSEEIKWIESQGEFLETVKAEGFTDDVVSILCEASKTSPHFITKIILALDYLRGMNELDLYYYGEVIRGERKPRRGCACIRLLYDRGRVQNVIYVAIAGDSPVYIKGTKTVTPEWKELLKKELLNRLRAIGISPEIIDRVKEYKEVNV